MSNPYAHHPDCEFWHDLYENECTCTRPGWKPPAADLAQETRAILAEIADLKRRVEDLEARATRLI